MLTVNFWDKTGFFKENILNRKFCQKGVDTKLEMFDKSSSLGLFHNP